MGNLWTCSLRMRLRAKRREVSNDHYRFKLAWLERLRSDLVDEVARQNTSSSVVIGTSRPPMPTCGTSACSTTTPPTCQSPNGTLLAITDVGLRDTFRERYPADGDLYSWWDYRGGNFHKRKGMRIDFLLSNPRWPMQW